MIQLSKKQLMKVWKLFSYYDWNMKWNNVILQAGIIGTLSQL